jgi:outer membrane protein assembly factor BamB
VTKTARVAMTTLLLCGCGRADAVPHPSFSLVFPPIVGDLMTISSPSVIDLTGDSVPDIVFGTGVDRVQPRPGRMVFTGEPEVSGYVVAVSGATNEILWRAPNPRDAFTTPRFTDLNRDSVADVIMGGREGALSAFNGVDGTLLWRVAPARVARTTFPYNFFAPGLIRDANGDRVPDLVVVYGGDDTKLPSDPREPSYLAVVSGADGAILAVHKTPDGGESYSSVVVYDRPDGTEWLIFGTGGETHGGAAYRAPVASLLDGSFATRAETLVAPGAKGVIAPATLVELTGDRDLDILISTFDGRLVALNGATGKPLWERRDQGEEAYHSAAVVRLSREGRLGLFVSRGIGAFPRYVASVHRLLDAADGRVLYQYRDPFYPAGAPLAVDLTGDGVDEPFFFSVRFPTAQGARAHVLHLASGRLITHEIATNFWTTPVIVDARGAGTLEMIGLSWRQGDTPGVPSWRDVQWQLLRMELGAKTPAFRSWAAYMGTTTDGHYHQW